MKKLFLYSVLFYSFLNFISLLGMEQQQKNDNKKKPGDFLLSFQIYGIQLLSLEEQKKIIKEELEKQKKLNELFEGLLFECIPNYLYHGYINEEYFNYDLDQIKNIKNKVTVNTKKNIVKDILQKEGKFFLDTNITVRDAIAVGYTREDTTKKTNCIQTLQFFLNYKIYLEKVYNCFWSAVIEGVDHSIEDKNKILSYVFNFGQLTTIYDPNFGRISSLDKVIDQYAKEEKKEKNKFCKCKLYDDYQGECMKKENCNLRQITPVKGFLLNKNYFGTVYFKEGPIADYIKMQKTKWIYVIKKMNAVLGNNFRIEKKNEIAQFLGDEGNLIYLRILEIENNNQQQKNQQQQQQENINDQEEEQKANE